MYIGGWENDLKNGFGKFTYDNGDIYEGNWLGGVKSGQGKLILANGDNF